jgi:CSLREA domain-containing protein
MLRLSIFLLLLAPTLVRAATFTVDTTSDAALDACTAAPDDCSLRGAIGAANALAGSDRIEFDLSDLDAGFQPATAHWRIALGSELQNTGALEIDGFSQAGAQRNANAALEPVGHTLKVEIRGPNSSNVNCILAIGSLTVRGLVMNNCNQAIFMFEPGPHLVEGSHLGTDVTGLLAPSPNRFGVALGGDATIGLGTPASANVIAGNLRGGLVQFRAMTHLRIQGNIIGPNASLTTTPGVQDYGVHLLGPFPDSLIGGPTPEEANTISGNAFNGILVSQQPQSVGGAASLRIQGNIIGTGIDGIPLGNGYNSGSPSQTLPTIQIGNLGHCRIAIGGTGEGEGNLIAYGANAGVAVGACWGAAILGNSFLGNRRQVIDLATSNNFDGPTLNDVGDGDGSGTDPFGASLGNRYQNMPALVGEARDALADSLTMSLRVDSATTAQAYPLRLDFYARDELDMLTTVQTETYALADAQQVRDYVLTLSAFERGGGITVTDAEGNTSEMLLFGDLFSDGFEDPID